MSDPGIPPVPAPVPPAEVRTDADFARLRIDLENQKKAAQEALDAKTALEARLTELERKDLDEKQRMTLELEDAKKAATEAERLRAENGQFVSALEKLYTDRLAQVPDDKRALVESLSSAGDWATRMTQLESAIGLAGIPATPARAGTFTQPPGSPPPPPEAPKPLTPEELRKTSLGSIIGGIRANRTNT